MRGRAGRPRPAAGAGPHHRAHHASAGNHRIPAARRCPVWPAWIPSAG